MQSRIVPISRTVEARLVPTGTPTTIPQGAFVTLTQTLGGAYTVVFEGNMARVEGEDGDALGLEPVVLEFEPPTDGKPSMEQVQQALASVYDPEIPVNIVELGLVYRCDIVAGDAPPRSSLHARGAPSRSPAEGSLHARGAPSRSPAEGSLHARGAPSRSPAEGSLGVVQIELTLTAPGCGMGQVLVDDVKRRVARVPFVSDVDVQLVFDPPWSRDMMTEEAQLALGIF